MQEQKVDVLIYRVRENGLEVFLVDPSQNAPKDASNTLHPPTLQEMNNGNLTHSVIELEPVTDEDGNARMALAIEADWHEIPSLRALMYEDYRVAKEKAKEHIRLFVQDFEKGAYVAVKEATKRVMPVQYAFLKELKDIVSDKNQTKYI
jgi:hypothetical protein